MEVASKALITLGPQAGVKFILYGAPKPLKLWKRPLEKRFRISVSDRLKDCLDNLPSSKADLHLIQSEEAPVAWVKEASLHCLRFPSSCALVTGPLSKTGIKEAGFPYIGHTELLKKVSRKRDLFQVYLGSKMNVLLVTDHISLAEVPKRLAQRGLIEKAVLQGLEVRKAMRMKGPLAFLALDPHAGEEGVIGKQDQHHQRVLQRLPIGKGELIGPLPADSAFEESLRKKVSLYIALYHDQGLIPFKSLHGFGEGVHLTAGLPFVRTSVDHGTAKNLFGKNKADPGSMTDAIRTALKMVRKTR